jgi:hypothetical protein
MSMSDEQTTPPSLTIEQIIQSAKELKKEASPPANGIATDSTVLSVCTEILNEIKTPISPTNINKTRLTIAALAQEGATSPRFNESRTCNIFDINISVSLLRKAAQKNRTTVRALGRALRTEAIQVAQAFDIEENLSKSYKLQHPAAPPKGLHHFSFLAMR